MTAPEAGLTMARPTDGTILQRRSEGGAVSATTPAENEKRNGPRSRKGERTRARLLGAAKQIFEEHGFLDARISDIAERAELSHGSFYHYFDSKEQVFREVAAAVDEQLSAPLSDVILAPSSTAPPHERLREALRRHFESYRAEARIMGVIEQVSRYHEPVRDVRFARQQHYLEQAEASIRHLQKQGLADPELDAHIAASALTGMVGRFAEAWFVQGVLSCDYEDGVEQLTNVCVNALRLQDPPAGARRRARRP